MDRFAFRHGHLTASVLKAALSNFDFSSTARTSRGARTGGASCDPELGMSRDLDTSTHSLLASFLPQQLRQQEAAAAEADEKEEMELAEGKQAANEGGSMAGRGRTKTPFCA